MVRIRGYSIVAPAVIFHTDTGVQISSIYRGSIIRWTHIHTKNKKQFVHTDSLKVIYTPAEEVLSRNGTYVFSIFSFLFLAFKFDSNYYFCKQSFQ